MALLPDQKFSTFDNGGDLIAGDIVVGLRDGINARFDYTGTLAPGVVVPILQGGTGATTATGARTNLGLGTLALQNENAVSITGGSISNVSLTGVTGVALTKTDDTNVTLTLGGSPNTALLETTSLTVGWTGILGLLRGGTGVSSPTIVPLAAAYSAWDSSTNLSANNFLTAFASTVSAAGNTVLTVSSAFNQEITGSTTQTITMPVTSTITAGHTFKIINNSSGNVTLNSSGGNLILLMAANTVALITCVLASGTTAASWNSSYIFDSGAGVLSITGTANQVIASASTGAVTLSLPQSIATSSSPTFASLVLTNPHIAGAGGLVSFQVFASGTAATYTKPAGVTSILVEVVGGGGGGGGSAGGVTGVSGGSGGGSGGYAWLYVPSAASSYTYTVGAGGTGATAGTNNGGNGGTTTFSASSLQATGGTGGTGATNVAPAATLFFSGGPAGVGSNGTFNCSGEPGGYSALALGQGRSGNGGSSIYGGGAVCPAGAATGNAGSNYGSGGSGGISLTVSSGGGPGSVGVIVVWEFC